MTRLRFTRRADRHARFLELLSRQLDEPLRLDETWQLSIHLRGCGRCRTAEREYREQRRRLRALGELSVPRDLGARVSAALDREVLRGHGRHVGGAARALWPAGATPARPVVVGTSAAVSLAVLTIGALAVLSSLPFALPEQTTLRPTPMNVPGQPLAYVGAGPNGLALYRTSIDRVCPVSALDCVVPQQRQPLLALSGSMLPSSVALSPGGDRLVISARDAQSHEDVFTVVLMPHAGADRPRSGSVRASESPRAIVTASASSGTPAPPTERAATDSPVATGAPVATDPPVATDKPVATEPTEATDPTPPTGSTTPAPRPAETEANDGQSAEPTDSVASSPTAPGRVTVGATSSPVASEPRSPAAPPSPPRATIEPTLGVPTPVSTAEALTTVAILEDVRGAGAPPAWSADGSTLAFSAMPADGSRGPDVYVWRPGDATAEPITNDHASYFASWAGDHIVASRAGNGTDTSTVLIHPTSGDQTTVDGLAVWLPQVNGSRTHAIAWHGELEMSGSVVKPTEGALYVFEWSRVDPFATGAEPRSSAVPRPTDGRQPEPTEPAATESAGNDESRARLTLPPLAGDAGDGEATGGRPSGPAGSAEPAEAEPRERSPERVASATAKPRAAAAPSVVLVPLEPGREITAAPVLDWEVRWAPDGTALGFWIADVPGASWGRLAVVPFGPDGQLGLDSPLLEPTLARRSFTMGYSRVAFVAPADSTPDGELRISVWGPDGSGVMRFSAPDLHEVLAAF